MARLIRIVVAGLIAACGSGPDVAPEGPEEVSEVGSEVSGVNNLVLTLDGNGDSISLASYAGIQPSGWSRSLTIEAWVNLAAQNPRVAQTVVDNAGRYRLSVDAQLHPEFCVGLNTNPVTFRCETFGNLTLEVGQWNFIAAVFDNDLNEIRVRLRTTTSAPTRTVTPVNGNLADADTNNNNVRLGASHTGNYFSGQLDEIRIWNTARNDGQIDRGRAQNLNCGLEGLVGYWRIDGTNFQNESCNRKVNGVTVGEGTLVGASANTLPTGTPALLTKNCNNKSDGCVCAVPTDCIQSAGADYSASSPESPGGLNEYAFCNTTNNACYFPRTCKALSDLNGGGLPYEDGLYNIKPANQVFSAYCLETNVPSDAGHTYTGAWTLIQYRSKVSNTAADRGSWRQATNSERPWWDPQVDNQSSGAGIYTNCGNATAASYVDSGQPCLGCSASDGVVGVTNSCRYTKDLYLPQQQVQDLANDSQEILIMGDLRYAANSTTELRLPSYALARNSNVAGHPISLMRSHARISCVGTEENPGVWTFYNSYANPPTLITGTAAKCAISAAYGPTYPNIHVGSGGGIFSVPVDGQTYNRLAVFLR